MARRVFAPARGWFRRWSYSSTPEAGTKRDLRLDLLRGFCVVVMVADHIGGESSWLYVITSGNRFFTSAAEGFVLISGITMGMVYRGVIDRYGLTTMLSRVMRRAGFLYLLTVGMTIVFSIVSMWLNTPWSQYAQPAGPIEFALGVGTLHRSYSLVDVLMLYTLLVFASPPLLYLLATGRTKLVIAGAWALWLLWQVSPEEVQFPWAVVDGGFPFAAWQVLFATGVVLGYHRERLKQIITPRLRIAIVAVGLTLAVTLIALFQMELGDPKATDPSAIGWLLSSDLVFGKNDLRPGRIVALLGVATTIFTLVTIFWVPVRRALGWLLMPLGQRALGAYALHLFIIAAAHSWIGDPLRSGGEHTLIQVVGIILIWAALPLLPWLAEIEHLATRATLAHPLARFLGVRRQAPEAA
jgi:hypothetical protein